jgi:Xaa-Pro aminopeptidase
MSGPHSAEACGAYARSRGRRLSPGDLVLVHCNSYLDGYWTDVTRTYCLGEPGPRHAAMYAAVLAASAAALAAIRPGVRGRDVDRAARQALAERGFGEQFKHSTGHGVGFAAIDHNARPRLHPVSDDVLEIGMVFNVEPAVYLDGYGGIRHCDVVAVTEGGAAVLTPFQSRIEQLAIR